MLLIHFISKTFFFLEHRVAMVLSTDLFASLIAQLVKNLPAMQETQFLFLSWEDPLEKEMVTHSSILAWRIPWMEEPGGLLYVGS